MKNSKLIARGDPQKLKNWKRRNQSILFFFLRKYFYSILADPLFH